MTTTNAQSPAAWQQITSYPSGTTWQQRWELSCRSALVLLAFVIPISTAATLGALFLFITTWFLSGRIDLKFTIIAKHPITPILLLFYGLFILGSFYSNAPPKDIFESLWKYSKLLYPLLLLPIIQDETWRHRIFWGFSSAMLLTLFLGYLKLYTPLPFPIHYTSACIFKNHIDTNLLMSFACYFAAISITLVSRPLWQRDAGILLIAMMSFYIFWMNEGRAGYIIFACLWGLFFLQMLNRKRLHYLIVGFLSFCLLFSAVLFSSHRFHKRLNNAMNDLVLYQAGKTNTSLGARLEFLSETWNLSMEKPWFGHGTGSFKQGYEAHALQKGLIATRNPHNEYLNVLYQLGFAGLSLLILLFVTLIKLSFHLPRKERYLLQALVLSMVVGCAANSWFLDFTPGYFFMLLSMLCLSAFKPKENSIKENSKENWIKKNSIKKDSISVIVTTYNWPMALGAVLRGLACQTIKNFEIIIADDGSGPETKALIETMQAQIPIPIRHIWQEDRGFRAAEIRNKAVLAAQHDYVLFMDGDCIPRKNFIAQHQSLAEAGFFVTGNRILLNEKFTQQVLSNQTPIHAWTLLQWARARFNGHCNRFLSLLVLPLGFLRKAQPKNWQGVKGCNLALWKSDLFRVNGWDENFTGWGYEDSDLVLRLLASGIKRKEGRFCVPVIHLWHPHNDRSQEARNWARLQSQQKDKRLVCEKGLLQNIALNV